MAVARLSIEELAKIVETRKGADPDTSYTAKLLHRGVGQCAKKLGEEAAETVIAGVAQDDDALRAESADLLYHLLVLLESRDVPIVDVLAVLQQRMGVSGLDEKASRTHD